MYAQRNHRWGGVKRAKRLMRMPCAQVCVRLAGSDRKSGVRIKLHGVPSCFRALARSGLGPARHKFATWAPWVRNALYTPVTAR